MDLLKISISKDARIEQAKLVTYLHRAEFSIDEIKASLPMERPALDNIRLAVSYRLRKWQRFETYGETCKAICAPTTSKAGLDLRIHVQVRSAEVDYTNEPVVTIKGDTSKSSPVQITTNDRGYNRYPDLVRDLCDVEDLQRFGEGHYFESDLRRMLESLLDGVCVPLWPGLRLILTPEARVKVDVLQGLLEALDAGSVKLACLSLDHTPANKLALAHELAEGFQTQLAKLEERLGYTAPNVAAITKEYQTLEARIALVEQVLDVEIPCSEALVGLEVALSVAE